VFTCRASTPRPRPLLVTATALSLAAFAFVHPAPAHSFTITKTNVALDDQTVMSPAAERIVTMQPDKGELIGPGSTIERTVIITNRTHAATSFTLSLADVVGSRDGSIAEVRHGVIAGAAAWATIERPSFTLQPGEQAADTVTIHIPAKVTPGSKSFAVVATLGGSINQAGGAGVATQFEQDAIYTVELPGDTLVKGTLTKAEITSAQQGIVASEHGDKPPVNSRFYVGPGIAGTHRLTLTTTYANGGERLLQPSGRVVITDVFGRVAGRYAIPQFTVYPKGSADGQVELRGLPSLGLFTATVELSSDAGSQKTQLPRFLFVPKWLLGVVIAALLWGLYRLVRFVLARRDERRYGGVDDTGEPQPGEAGYAEGDDEWSMAADETTGLTSSEDV
jgi:hypothetical protein